MTHPPATDTAGHSSHSAQIVGTAAQLSELGLDDLIAVVANLSDDARQELMWSAACVADDRRRRPGTICGLCGALDHLTPQCALAFFATARGEA